MARKIIKAVIRRPREESNTNPVITIVRARAHLGTVDVPAFELKLSKEEKNLADYITRFTRYDEDLEYDPEFDYQMTGDTASAAAVANRYLDIYNSKGDKISIYDIDIDTDKFILLYVKAWPKEKDEYMPTLMEDYIYDAILTTRPEDCGRDWDYTITPGLYIFDTKHFNCFSYQKYISDKRRRNTGVITELATSLNLI